MVTLVVNYSQLDVRWADNLLGFNTDPQYTFKNYACLLCCLADALRYFGIDTDPLRLNQLLKDKEAFMPGGAIYKWGSLAAIFPNISDSVTKTPSKLTDAQIGEIKNALDAGKPVICQIDYNPKQVLPTMHFVTFIGYNPNDENDFTIADPLGGTTHSLKDYLGFFHPSARDTIESYCIIDGPVPQLSAANTLPVNKDVFPLIVHGSDQWDKTIAKYMPDNDPKTTDYEAFTKVIGGIQSRTTDFSRQVDNQKGDLQEAKASVLSLQEQLANEELQRQKDREMYLAQNEALKTSGLNIDKIASTYEGRITTLQGQVKELLTDKQKLAIDNARLQTNSPISVIETYFPTFLSFAKKLFTK